MGRAVVATPAMWERLKVWLQAGSGHKVPAQLNFTNATLRHMHDPARHVPHHILREAIRFGQSLPDPRGAAQAFYMVIFKNGNPYNLKVIYDRATNTVLHFHYTREAMGPLSAILR